MVADLSQFSINDNKVPGLSKDIIFAQGKDYALKNSIIFDRAIRIYLVNNDQLLFKQTPVDPRDYILAGRERLKVISRGRRRIESHRT